MGLLSGLGRIVGSVARVAAPIVGGAVGGPAGAALGMGVSRLLGGGGGSQPNPAASMPQAGPVQYGPQYGAVPGYGMPHGAQGFLGGVGGVTIDTPYGQFGVEAGQHGSRVIPGWMWVAGPLGALGIITAAIVATRR